MTRKFKLIAIMTAAVAVIFTIAVEPRLQAVDIYVLSGTGSAFNNTTTAFGKIDTATGMYTQISSAVSGSNLVGNLAWNPNISAFYVTENALSATTLRTLTTSGTLSSQIGSNIGLGIYGMAYRPADDTLYALSFSSNGTGTVSPTSGGFSTLSTQTGFIPGQLDPPFAGRYTMLNDTVYMTVNEATGQAGQFGTMGYTSSSSFQQIGSNNFDFKSMALASDGTNLYGIYSNNGSPSSALFSIDPTTGSLNFLSPIFGMNDYIYGAGIATVPVPEPSTYALGAISVMTLGFMARRRRRLQSQKA